MTDENQPRKTLKLNLSNVSINQDNAVKKTLGSSKAGANKTVMVEVKKQRTFGKKSDFNDATNTNPELDAKVNILKQAALKQDTEQESALLKIRKQEIAKYKEEQLSPKNPEITEIDDEDNEINEVVEQKTEEKKPTVSSQSQATTDDKNKQHKPAKLPEVKKLTKDEEIEEANKKAALKAKEDLKSKAADMAYAARGNKIDVRFVAESEDEDQPVRKRSMASIRRAREKHAKKLSLSNKKESEKIYREVIIPEVITVQELSARMTEKSTDVIRELMKLGVMATINQAIDADTAEIVTEALGHKSKRVQESDVENIIQNVQDNAENMIHRPPVVTIMGHVDHGKTSLLDALKSTDVASREAGGITQHIGAYQVKVDDHHYVTFLDTPGHEAFSAMRSRGAKVTDIVVLVVAADDGIMAQTVEAINHAKAAGVPIIVAINKIDKPEADPNRVKNELLQHELVVEALGGDIIAVEVSAKAKINLDKLIESILLQAEMMELKADPSCAAVGAVIESKIDKGRGVVATFLVQKGTIKVGDIIVAGGTSGKVRSLINDKGQSLSEAGPSMPVEVIGLDDAPIAGDPFNVVPSDKQAREIAEYRQRKLRELKNSMLNRTSNLHDIFSRAADGQLKELPLIIKGDVHGSVEAISASLNKLTNDEVRIKVLHSAVGGITESDVTLARATGAIILGFNVRASATARQIADAEGVDIRYYSIIYNLIDDIKGAVSGMLAPVLREEYIGNAEIRQVFNVTKFGKIAGCYVTKGLIKRGAGVRLIRNNIVIHEGKLKTLRRFQDDVKEVKEGFECGVAFENYEDIREKDTLEAFEIIEERKTI